MTIPGLDRRLALPDRERSARGKEARVAPEENATPDFMARGGEMGALMRAYDWAAHPLGRPEAWPQPLRTAMRLILNTGDPMYIWWGGELYCFYNDAYRQSIGSERHPSSLGQPAREVARLTLTWAGGVRRYSSTCCAARASRSPTRGRCFPILRACCASNPIQKACAKGSGGAPAPTPPPSGRQSWG